MEANWSQAQICERHCGRRFQQDINTHQHIYATATKIEEEGHRGIRTRDPSQALEDNSNKAGSRPAKIISQRRGEKQRRTAREIRFILEL